MGINFKEWLERGEDELLEFDNRYCSVSACNVHKQKIKSRKQETFDNWIKSNTNVVNKLKLYKNRPSCMAYFDRIFTSDVRVKEIIREKNKGKKIVGTYCNMVPLELIAAAGAIPVRLCSGDNNAICAGEEIFPKDSCPLIKSSLGWALKSHVLFDLCDVVIIPATCDGKKKMAEILNDYKPVWVMNLPQDKERRRSVKYWESEVYILKQRLEKLTNRKITKETLKNSIVLYQEVQKTHKTMLELRKHAVISGSDFFIIAQAMFFANPGEWIENSKNIIAELNRRVKENNQIKEKDAIRLLLTGAPIILPNFKIPLLIESFDSVIIADLICSSSQFLYDPVVIDEWNMSDMMSAISERYLMPSVCPCFVKSEDRIDKILDTINEYKIDGVIYHTLRLCLLFDIESHRVKDVLDSKEIPNLSINVDYSMEDQGQLTTRIEAFLEILRERK